MANASETNWPIRIGVVVTLIWFGALMIYVVVIRTDADLAIWELKPNELGDFLAGWFSIPAFLWLVVGMLLQSRELSLQRRELEEVRKLGAEQASATERMAAAAETAADEERIARTASVRPRFLAASGGKAGIRLSIDPDTSEAFDVVVHDLVDDRKYQIEKIDETARGFGMKSSANKNLRFVTPTRTGREVSSV